MGHKTPLYDQHLEAGARIVDFGGWDMPLNYGSQIDEHHAVRQVAGMFDVSHMTVVDIDGSDATKFLRHLLANDVAKLKSQGAALYTCMLAEDAGVLDDLIVYFDTANSFRLIVNAATREKDVAWITARASEFTVTVSERPELAMLAVQGPKARALAARCLPSENKALALKPFHSFEDSGYFVARTGYTGEDGFEIVASADAMKELWCALIDAGVQPCGLGARDSLRLEAGLNLYGSDMDETTHPFEANLAWTLSFDDESRDFIGRAALEKIRAAGPTKKMVGLILQDRGVLRAHQAVTSAAGTGETLSGGFSPTLKKSIAFARVPIDCGDNVDVDIRGKGLKACVVRPPFVRRGKAVS